MPMADFKADKKRKLARFLMYLVTAIIAVGAILGAFEGSIFPTGNNALQFSTALAQVSITMVAIDLALLVYLSRSKSLESSVPTVSNTLLLSSILFVAAALLALLIIALVPSGEAITSVDRARTISPAMLFLGGMLTLYVGVQDILPD